MGYADRALVGVGLWRLVDDIRGEREDVDDNDRSCMDVDELVLKEMGSCSLSPYRHSSDLVGDGSGRLVGVDLEVGIRVGGGSDSSELYWVVSRRRTKKRSSGLV